MLSDPNNVDTVRTLYEQFEASWAKFEDSHNHYMSMVSSDSQEFYQMLKQFDQLHLEKTAFEQEISRYLLNSAVQFDEVNTRSHLLTENVSAYPESVAACGSDISRTSRYSSSSAVLEKRAQAVKANVALRWAEQEQWRKLEGEIKLLEIEKKHKELLRQQRMEMEEIERAKRLETLRQQSERELAEARQRAAMMDLEAQLEEQMEEQGGIDMNLTTQVQEEIPVAADQFTGDIPIPLLYEDFIFEDEPRGINENPALSTKLPPSTPVVAASSPWKPRATSTSAAIFGEFNPVATTTQANTGSTRICAPISSIDDALMSSDGRRNVTQSAPEDIYPHTMPVCYKNRSPLPAFNYSPCPPARWTSVSDVASQPSNSEIKLPFHAMEHKIPVPVYKPTDLKTPRPKREMGAPTDDVLTMVASAMKDISSVQQRLASNQSLPPVELNKFSGSPEEFPVFKQRFERRIMSREDLGDDEKMARLLQFLGGEAKEAVAALEGVSGGVHEALKILQKRYGRRCVVVTSVVDGLVKGPAITDGDKAALQRFADKTVRALATLQSLDCLHEINQGNLVEMAGRLPRQLQQRFAALANELEEREERFPTLSDLSAFVDKWANIANHPINSIKGKTREGVFQKETK